MGYIDRVIKYIEDNYKNEKEFVQSAKEILKSLNKVVEINPIYEKERILERIIIPDRVVMFKVMYEDDNGVNQVHNGYRVQFNNALGPYKGGIRFHPSVNLSILKFLGFEQIFKNALTGLPLGGGKGGSDFDPKGKSEIEIKRFCISFMNELYHYIGSDKDVPAGDIGVGQKEIGYLYGQYKKLTNQSLSGVITGKGVGYGGSLLRKEATGYGLIYFVERMLSQNNDTLKNKRVMISGSGNVALHAAKKAVELGAKVITISDSKGYIYDKKGVDLSLVSEIKEKRKGRIKEYLDYKKDAVYGEGSVYDANINVDIVLPCATQNEIDLDRVKNIINNGCILLAEGANMPLNNEAINYLLELDGFLYAPGKAANAGGVSVSGLEMVQNSQRYYFSGEQVDKMLKEIMYQIHDECINTCLMYGEKPTNYVFGANARGFVRVADAMIAQNL